MEFMTAGEGVVLFCTQFKDNTIYNFEISIYAPTKSYSIASHVRRQLFGSITAAFN